MIAAKGGTLAGITAGDCLELMETRDAACGPRGSKGGRFYQLLHAMGTFPAGAGDAAHVDPRFQGQLSTAELVDQYALACARSATSSPATWTNGAGGRLRDPEDSAYLLGKLFWKDLEAHNPGIARYAWPPEPRSRGNDGCRSRP